MPARSRFFPHPLSARARLHFVGSLLQLFKQRPVLKMLVLWSISKPQSLPARSLRCPAPEPCRFFTRFVQTVYHNINRLSLDFCAFLPFFSLLLHFFAPHGGAVFFKQNSACLRCRSSNIHNFNMEYSSSPGGHSDAWQTHVELYPDKHPPPQASAAVSRLPSSCPAASSRNWLVYSS